uniref:Protein disulfide-isomerase n=1 Tax=Blastobotrys adeninivorans TaxID=409370 RepID=A0A060T118_BLAAD
MNFSLKTLAVIAAAISSVVGSDVVKLTNDDFEDFVSEHPLVMAEFFAPWCGHCKALAPEYEKAATELKEKGIPMAQIDCTENEDLCAEQKVQGYPTLKVFHGLDKVSQYTGPRKAEALVPYMVRQSLPAITEVSEDNVEEFSKSDKLVAIGFYNDKKSTTTFDNLAEGLREKYIFGASKDADLAKKYGVKDLPAVVVFKNFEDSTVVYDSTAEDFKFSQNKIKEFIVRESFPTIGEIGPATFADYAQSDMPLLYIFVDSDKDKESLTKTIKPLAAKLKGKANIGFLNATLYGAHAANVNLREEWPAVAIQDFKQNLKYVHSQDESITKKSLTKFVEDYVAGKLEPSVKSEPIPTTQEGDVVKVVGKSYRDVVLDDDKDVLIEFYAPWCGHCKNLAPTYEELAALYKDDNFSKYVTVAKVDHTVNDVPDEIKGYPTIKLYPAGKKDKPVDFNGARTLEGLAEFIKEKGTHGIDGLVAKAKAEEDEPEEVDLKDKASDKEEL